MNEEITGVSIIICCFNSAKRLPETIRHVALQENLDNIKWEVIIVDNNSTDKTIAVAKKEWTKYCLDIPFTVVQENRQGLSFARKKGVEMAKYDLLIFCDDDNWLQEDYMHFAFEIMKANKNIGIAGGRSVA